MRDVHPVNSTFYTNFLIFPVCRFETHFLCKSEIINFIQFVYKLIYLPNKRSFYDILNFLFISALSHAWYL